jgi:competence ComEA-like helix-hairpin-helix protein
MNGGIRLPLLGFLGALVLLFHLGWSGDAAANKPPVAPVDLNSATVEQLCTLPGIGPKKAEAIVTLREKQRFVRPTQLLRVKGIGPKILEKLRPHIRIEPPANQGKQPKGGPEKTPR